MTIFPPQWRVEAGRVRRPAVAARSGRRLRLLLPLVLALGCGKRDPVCHPAGGTVMFEGRPMAGFTVEFSSQSPETRGLSASGVVGADGSFSLRTRIRGRAREGAVAGPHRVVVVPPPPAVQPGPVPPVPIRYADYLSSGLTAEIVAGGTTSVALELQK